MVWREAFVIKKVKNTVPWAYVISDLKHEEIVGMVYEKELQKKKKFWAEEVIRRKGDKLFAKWKGYENSLNSWIDKKMQSINEWIFSRTEIYRRKCESSIRFI